MNCSTRTTSAWLERSCRGGVGVGFINRIIVMHVGCASMRSSLSDAEVGGTTRAASWGRIIIRPAYSAIADVTGSWWVNRRRQESDGEWGRKRNRPGSRVHHESRPDEESALLPYHAVPRVRRYAEESALSTCCSICFSVRLRTVAISQTRSCFALSSMRFSRKERVFW